MTALPPATDFTGAAVTEGDFKTAVTNMRAYLAGITDTTGIVADARTQLGLGSLAIKSTIATADVDAGAITAAKLGTCCQWTRDSLLRALWKQPRSPRML